MTRNKRSFLGHLVLLLVFFGALGFLVFAIQRADKPWTFLAGFGVQKHSASWSVLEEIRDIRELQTASYTMKSVFPYDFVDAGAVDWSFLQQQYDRSPSLFLEKTHPAWHPGGRLPEQWNGAEIYALCREIGIDPGRPDYRFLVITSQVTAGIDFDSWLAALGEVDDDGEVPGISIRENEDGSRTLALSAPPVRVSSFVVEDRDTAAEGFPDVPMSPDRWRILVEALEPRLLDLALDNGLLDAGKNQAQAFLSEIFTAAGYQYVVFE